MQLPHLFLSHVWPHQQHTVQLSSPMWDCFIDRLRFWLSYIWKRIPHNKVLWLFCFVTIFLFCLPLPSLLNHWAVPLLWVPAHRVDFPRVYMLTHVLERTPETSIGNSKIHNKTEHRQCVQKKQKYCLIRKQSNSSNAATRNGKSLSPCSNVCHQEKCLPAKLSTCSQLLWCSDTARHFLLCLPH